jgi:hypothetical protein
MQRRNVLIGLGGAAAAAGGVRVTPASAQSEAAVPDIGPYAEPWDPADADVPERRNIAKFPEDYFTPGRFAGKTVIVTGCARGMGAGAAWRLAREGENVVGDDWLKDQGRATMEEIAAEGHATRFVLGDVGEDATCARMIEVAVEAFGVSARGCIGRLVAGFVVPRRFAGHAERRGQARQAPKLKLDRTMGGRTTPSSASRQSERGPAMTCGCISDLLPFPVSIT